MATRLRASDLVLENGQFIQPVKQPNKKFKLEHAKFDFQELVEISSYNFETKVPVTAGEFEAQFNEKRARLLLAMPNICQNVILPGLLPPSPQGDIGTNLAVYIKAIERGYKKEFLGNVFYGPGKLKGRVQSVQGTGHERILAVKEWTPFVYVADCMRCWPVTVQRTPQPVLIKLGLSVAGGYDGFSILSLHPTILASEWTCPGIDYSGLEVDHGDSSLCAKSFIYNLSLTLTDNVGVSIDHCSGAVSFLG